MPAISLKRIQSGFAMVAAIAILVILAALGTFAIRISTTQHTSFALDIQSSQVYQAARAGLEWGIYSVVNGNCVSADIDHLPGEMSVTITCTASPTSEPSAELFTLTAIACNQPNNAAPHCPATQPTDIYVERRLNTIVER
jgi:MSHA biogenesis protein MshP